MIDHDWTAEDVPFTGKAAHVPRFDLAARLSSAAVAACLFLLVLYPWSGDFDPEGNWLPGPLWMFKSQGSADKLIGAIATAVLTLLIFTYAIKPCRLGAAMSIAAILAWVGFGMLIASMAAC